MVLADSKGQFFIDQSKEHNQCSHVLCDALTSRQSSQCLVCIRGGLGAALCARLSLPHLHLWALGLYQSIESRSTIEKVDGSAIQASQKISLGGLVHQYQPEMSVPQQPAEG